MLFSSEVFDISLRALMVSGSATILASCWSIPIAHYLAIKHRSEFVTSILEALVGIPTTVIGLLFYFLFSSKGPLGFLHLLYSPQAIIIGQSVLITPLIISTGYRVIRSSTELYGELAISLGASKWQAMALTMRESMPGIIASVVMGFSRAFGELGVALMIGGNIRGYTRVLTTAIVLEVSKGEFEKALSLGLILVTISISLSIVLRVLRRLS